MILTNPAVAYITIRDAIVTLLKNNVVTLNSGLTSGLTFPVGAAEQITGGNPYVVPVPASLYPRIFVELIGKTEEFFSLGANGHKKAELTYRIYALTRNLVSSILAEDEVYTLTKNIESILRDNIKFDSNILFSQPTNTDFGIGLVNSETWVYIVAIDLLCTVEVQ